MYDQRGVKRSFCTKCNGEERCGEFERSEKTPFCGYCGCPPIKHKRMSDTDVPNNVDAPNDVDVDAPNNFDAINNVPNSNETSSSICNSIKFPQPLINSKENLNSLLPELPHCSQCVQNALDNRAFYPPTYPKKPSFFRSEANIPCLLSKEEILLSRQKIEIEWEKESPEKAFIKSLFRDTFNNRTSLLKEGASFQVFIQHYPVFKDATYVLYEFSMLLGRSKMLELSLKMKEFFEKLQNLNKSGSTLVIS